MSEMIEIIVRGVCVKSGQLLLCHTKGADNTYLPGGHVEASERAKDALVREIKEEMGLDSVAGCFLGAVEHSFAQHDGEHCEINLVFELDLPGACPDRRPESLEQHIDFCWLPLKDLKDSNLEPHVLREQLGAWLADEQVERWASTY